MTWEGAVLLVLVGFLAFGWVLYLLAHRVDRLHRKVLGSRATLELQLARRAAAAQELATSGALDPVESVLVADVARRAAECGPARIVADGLEEGSEIDEPMADGDRALVESELSRALRAVVESRPAPIVGPEGFEETLARLEASWYRLELARRFHNAHVIEVQRVRRKALVRLFRLAGRAPMPLTFDMDDARPQHPTGERP